MDDKKLDEAAQCIQRMYRCHNARKLILSIASTVYCKCYDEASGLYYYYNLKTGDTTWDRPKVFKSNTDAPNYDVGPEVDSLPKEKIPLELPKTVKMQREEEFARRQESIKLIMLRAQAKANLEKEKKKNVHQGRKAWDKRYLQQQQQVRKERQRQLVAENKQNLQNLLDGKAKLHLGSIRDASMRGDYNRVTELLQQGFSPNAESAMGLTPLLAACGNGHLAIVQLLLENGADVNHRHIITKRTPYMEACERTNVEILRELLRYGARIHWQDKQGRSAADGITNEHILTMHTLATKVWSTQSNFIFPTPFRRATLSLMFVSKCQRQQASLNLSNALKKASTIKLESQKHLVEAKVRYDTEMRQCQSQPVLIRRQLVTEDTDLRFDEARIKILLCAEEAVLLLHRASQPKYLTEANVILILSFCSRHWFEQSSHTHQNATRKNECTIYPTRHRTSLTILPSNISDPLDENTEQIQRMSQELQHVEATQYFDSISGVSCDKTLKQSQASVCINILEAVHLARRPNRQLIDPFVRVRVLDKSGKPLCDFQATEPRFEDEWPSWDHSMTISIPSIYTDIQFQVMDNANYRPELAGEVRIHLRDYLDQKEHDQWLILPPTLKQQLLECDKPRTNPAKLHILITFTHAKVHQICCTHSQDD
ncbi:hypothetical protein THRCLA_05190 [Thraustotheca clavata]|uniref:Uncharacterized protein n=1 Tax=Thraustotheca clavata TaxID=74557 RepID=A0A1V9ZWV4_9STRA|nr:hypothetical protein THRCLA_05190 [Thraustotheca clavata]